MHNTPGLSTCITAVERHDERRTLLLLLKTTDVMDYSAAITQLRGHFTKSRFKTVAQLNADVC